MADESRSSTPGKGHAFNRMYFCILAAIVVLILGLYLFFAGTRQPHSTTSGSGTQKGMVTTTSNDLSS